MAEQDQSDSKRKYLQNTHDAYRLFYTVLLTIGLSEGFNSVIPSLKDIWPNPALSQIQTILLFGVFVFVVLRFFLGGIRHLDTTYIEAPFEDLAGSKVSSQRFRALDIGLLSVDAGLIIVLGSTVRNLEQFFFVFAVLLLIDALWAIVVSYRANELFEGGELTDRTKWGINNGLHFCIIVVVFCLGSWEWLILFGFTNSVADIVWTFDTYFPPL